MNTCPIYKFDEECTYNDCCWNKETVQCESCYTTVIIALFFFFLFAYLLISYKRCFRSRRRISNNPIIDFEDSSEAFIEGKPVENDIKFTNAIIEDHTSLQDESKLPHATRIINS